MINQMIVRKSSARNMLRPEKTIMSRNAHTAIKNHYNYLKNTGASTTRYSNGK
uniref:Uncharacterized protein n=1 Tax=Arundo donax TaxID=35708 RepID=A0A0A9EXY3_ARUDO